MVAGLTFAESRRIVLQSLRDYAANHAVGHVSNEAPKDQISKLDVAYVAALLSVIILLVISVLNSDPTLYPGLLASIGVILFQLGFNLLLLRRANKSTSAEVIHSLEKIFNEYEASCKNTDTSPSSAVPSISTKPDETATGADDAKVDHKSNHLLFQSSSSIITAGHARISVVSCFRNNAWHRIPSLLLAQGDIVALQCGDVTPGRCYEMDNELETGQHHDILEKGTQIFRRGFTNSAVNNSIPFAQSQQQIQNLDKYSYKRHKSLPSDGLELLELSGDMRCYCMTETPVRSYVEEVLMAYKHESHIKRKSLLRLFFLDALRRGFIAMLALICLVVIAAVIRLSVLPSSRIHWSLVLSVPLASVIICFIPLFVPLFVVVADTLLTANFLATTEAIIYTDTKKAHPKKRIRKPRHKRSKSTLRRPYSLDDPRTAGRPSRFVSEGDDGDDQSSFEEISEDEFNDEDIDERAEEIAEEASTRVLWTRILEYALIVLVKRFDLQFIEAFLSRFFKADQMLNIPFARTQLLEFLGGITMVCFIDDDVICEGFSVSEEIFVLKSHDDTKPSLGSLDTNGVILDLHANPEAHGSRFEDPQWWKLLPSLKPIGLNAMLTYSPLTSAEATSIKTLGRVDSASNFKSPLNGTFNKRVTSLQRLTEAAILEPDYPGISQTRLRKHAGKHSLQRNYPLEKSLVSLVRQTMPLESLRELAEEIGFSAEDTQFFHKVLEMNVIAPGLVDAKLMEDAHSWGQEETRRRGTLMTQVRSSVVFDCRSGGIQMMSQGDPALILHYCCEYWDGKSISPFTATDRKEILSVYDRWHLEDFDVVAFAYTPISVDLRKRVLQVFAETSSAQLQHSFGICANSTSHISFPASSMQSNCLYIVDPYTSDDLDSARALPTLQPVINSDQKQIVVPTLQNPSYGAQMEGQIESTVSIDKPFPDQVHSVISNEEMTNSKTPDFRKPSPALSDDVPPAPQSSPQRPPHTITLDEVENVRYSLSDHERGSINVVRGAEVSMPSQVTLSSESGKLMNFFRRDVKIGFNTADFKWRPHGSLSSIQSERYGERELLAHRHRDSIGTGNELLEEEKSHSQSISMSTSGFAAVPVFTHQVSLGLSHLRKLFASSRSGSAADSNLNATEHRDDEDAVEEDDTRMNTASDNLDDETSTMMIAAASLTVLNEMDDIDDAEGHHDENEPEAPLTYLDTDLDIAGRAFESPAYSLSVAASEAEYDGSDVGLALDSDNATGTLYSSVMPEDESLCESDSDLFLTRSDASMKEFQHVRTSRVRSKTMYERRNIASLIQSSSRQSLSNLVSPLMGENIVTTNIKVTDPESQKVVEKDTKLHLLKKSGSKPKFRRNSEPAGSPLQLSKIETFPMSTESLTSPCRSTADASGSFDYCFNSNELKSEASSPRRPVSVSQSDNALICEVVSSELQVAKARKLEDQLSHRVLKPTASTRKSITNIDDHTRGAKVRSIGASLWPYMRNQVFLGMAASSVPIKTEVADFREELVNAGIRFVYFSPRNMRRSKSVAEKLGIQFDWNCAISLRDLDGQEEHDPHRDISTYGDWDVHAKLPHGVDAIREHLRSNVDNVPLLVSLYTDSTPAKEYGEVVLSVGSAYREHNQRIFSTSDVGVAVAMLPGDTQDVPTSVEEVMTRFPVNSDSTLTRSDIKLHFQLVSLGTIPLLQSHVSAKRSNSITILPGKLDTVDGNVKNVLDLDDGNDFCDDEKERLGPLPTYSKSHEHSNQANPQIPPDTYHVELLQSKVGNSTLSQELQLSALMEGLRMGRVYLLNSFQAIAGLCVCCLGMALWPVLSNAIPLSIPPSLPPSIALLFMLIYIPCLLLSMLNGCAPDHVMKNTPRKNEYQQRRDEIRFFYYWLLRGGYIGVSVWLVGWFATASVNNTSGENDLWTRDIGTFVVIFSSDSATSQSQYFEKSFWLIQDVMSIELLLAMIAQLMTLQKRGQDLRAFPHPISHPWFYLAIITMLITHGIILGVRQVLRQEQMLSNDANTAFQYQSVDYRVWLTIFVMPIGGILLGTATNMHDDVSYRRYMQYLRFVFETKLGQYSPR